MTGKSVNKNGLKVVGWVSSDCEYFPECEDRGDEVIEAIAEELRSHSYLFGGDAHQEEWRACTPVLSDGTMASFSWRDWGYIVAVAYDLRGANGEYDHMCGYMDKLIVPEARRYPEERIDFSQITKKGKTHRLNLSDGVNALSRDYDMRAASDLPDIAVCDYVGFTRSDNADGVTWYKVTHIYREPCFEDILNLIYGRDRKETERLKAEAKEMKKIAGEKRDVNSEDVEVKSNYRQSVFHDLELSFENDNFNEYVSEEFGYEEGLTRTQLLERLYKAYPREAVERSGAVCFKLSPLMEGDKPDNIG